MKRLLTLTLDREFEQGFEAILEIRQGDVYSPAQTKIKGRLSGNRDVLNCYRDWQQRYLSLEMLFRALIANPEQVTNSSQRGEAFAACRQAAEVLEGSLNDWLFPWHRWDLLAEAEAEVALSAIEYDCPNNLNPLPTPKGKVRILAILGRGADINQDADKQALEELAGKAGAQITWREQPQASELNEQLWQQGWDILFFAGHSGTSEEEKRGEIQLNQMERCAGCSFTPRW